MCLCTRGALVRLEHYAGNKHAITELRERPIFVPRRSGFSPPGRNLSVAYVQGGTAYYFKSNGDGVLPVLL